MWINTTLLRLVREQSMALMLDIAANNTADFYKYWLRFLFMNFTLLDAVIYQKKCTPSDRANILSWTQNVLHHHLGTVWIPFQTCWKI
jgi:hypothetical protein